jgi:hypothetical protein
MSRSAATLLLVVVASSAGAAQPAIAVRKGTLTATLERVPVATVIATLVEQTGAELRGEVLTPHDVTVELHDVPLDEALERILGDQSFTLTYDADGRLKRIVLGGEAVRTPTAKPGAPVTAGGPAPWPPNKEVADAARRVAEFIQSDPTVPVRGRLAKALGTETSTFKQVVTAAIKHEDARVRAEARRATVKSLVADPELRVAVVTTIDSIPDDALVKALRSAAGADATLLANAFARHGRSPVLSRRMQRLISQLRAPNGDS